MSADDYPQRADFHSVLGRALIDPSFREALMDKERQAEALKSMGVEPTRETLDALNDSLEALSRLASSFGGPRAAT